MKKFRQILACVLTLVMCVSVALCTPAYAVTDTRNEAFASFRSDLVIPADQRDNLNQFIEFSLSPAVPGGVTTLTAYMHNNGNLLDENGASLKQTNLWGIVMDIDYGDLIPVEGTTDKYGRTFPAWTKGNPYNSRENFDANAYISPLKLNGEANPNLKSGRLTYGFHYEYPKCRVSGQMFTIDFKVPEVVTADTNLTVKVDKNTFKNTSAVQCLDYADASGNNATAIGNNFSFVSDTVELDYVETPVVSASQISRQGITLIWNSCFNAKNYNVYRLNNETDKFEYIAGALTQTSYTDTGLTSSNSYTYYVEAVGANSSTLAKSEYVSADFFNVNEKPAISAYGKSGKIKVEVDNPLYMADGVEIFYSTNKSMDGAASFTLEGEEVAEFEVQADTLYYVSARCYKTVGSEVYRSKTSDPTLVYASDAPHITHAYIHADGTVDLSWTKVQGVETYIVKVLDKDGAVVSTATVEGTSITLGDAHGIVIGSGQMFVVEANGVVSQPAQEVISPPQITEIRNTQTNAVELVLDIDPQNTYTVLRSIDGKEYEEITVRVVDNALVDESAKVGGVYSYKVKEYSAKFEKESEYSNPVTITLLADDCVVTGIVAKQTGLNKVVLTWDKVAGAKFYEVLRSTDGVNFKSNGKGYLSELYIDDEAVESVYYYQVVASAGNFKTQPSQIVVELDKTSPTTPALTVSQVDLNKVELSWDKIEGATKIKVSRWSEDPAWRFETTLPASVTNIKDVGLTQGKYIYTITAYGDKDYEKEISNQVEIVVKGKLSTPKISSAKYVKKNQIRVKYNKISGADGYELYRKIGSKGKYVKIKTVSAKYTYITDKTAKKAGTYYYRVKAINKAQPYLTSSYSSAKSVKVMSFSYKAKFKLAKAKKAFTFKFKSKHKNADGFQIQYSVKKNMKKAKYVNLKSSAKSKKVTKLKAKTTYYVRVRAYKKINGKKVYSVYSAKLKVKTK